MINRRTSKILIFFLALSVFLVFSTPSNRQQFDRKRFLINGRPWHGLTPVFNLDKGNYSGKRSSVTGHFMNKVDHFDTSNNETFKQYYWYNNKYYREGGPVFFTLGGESPQSFLWTENEKLPWVTLAKQHGAMVFLLEHRYYGKSRPRPNLSIPNMKYLSSRQAIEDAAAFIVAMNEKFNFTSDTKWIVFGSSYAGGLAAWARQLHPELIYGAVASSGPVQAVVDFYQYLDVVKNSLSTYSKECGNDLEEGMRQLYDLSKTSSGQNKIKDMFNLCNPWSSLSSKEIQLFWYGIIGTYMGIVQYSGDNIGFYKHLYTIKNVCIIHLDNSTTPLEHIQSLYSKIGHPSSSCLKLNYDAYLKFLKKTEYDIFGSDDRAWVYQTCTEFGYYQTTDNDAGNYWGHVIDVSWYVDQCTDIFGPSITNSTVYSSVTETNNYYGGIKNFNGSNVIFVNGNFDPWHPLSILTKTMNQNYPVIIDRASHCADIYPPTNDDIPSLTKARKTISEILSNILNQI